MKHVFVSYSRQNLTFAERLARDLDDAGFDVWLDVRQIKGGQEWRDAIFTGINQAEIVVVCLSPSAVESEWVRREILMARGQHKFVIPVMVEDAIESMRQYDETAQLLDVQIIDFEGRYERAFPLLLQALPGLEMVAPDTDIETLDPATIPNPFKGLEAFQQTDADIFFGREDLITRLLEKLREDRRFIAVVGASGSGKSSLVRAGLIPAIRRGELSESQDWPLVIFTPGSEPTKAMGIRLMPVLGEKVLPNLLAGLERGPDSLHLITAGLLVDAPSTARLVLVVDQFEEVFTRASKSEADQFLELLRVAATIPGGQTLVLLTLRADFFDRLSAYPDLAALFEQESMVIATEMTPENLRLSIEGPAAAVGLVYDHRLTDRILEDVRDQPGSLPLLQYALKELYERRDGRRLAFEAYESIGGVRRALAQHAEDTYTDMNAAQQDIMRRVLLRLVEVSDTGEATRRKVRRSELTFRDTSDRAASEVIDLLTAQELRLLVASREIATDEASDAEPTVWLEISHEALIREWERFTGWVAEDVEGLRYGGELLKAAGEWQRAERHPDFLLQGARVDQALLWSETADANDLQCAYIQASAAERDRQQARRRRLLAGTLVASVIVTLVMIVLALFAFGERNSAIDARGTSDVNVTQAVEAQGTSDSNAATATIALGQAERQAETAVAAQATSDRGEKELQSILWANQAQQAMNRDDQQLALPLALGAVSIDNPPSLAQITLGDVAYAPGMNRRIGQHHNSAVESVAFSPDGQTVLSGSYDHTLILWDVASVQALRTFTGHTDSVQSVAFSPDGQRVLSGSWDHTLILWRVDTLDSLIEWTYERRVVRELTCLERQTYSFEPGCEHGVYPSRTPYMTWTPSPTATATPTANLTRSTATPTRTITRTVPAWTPTATLTITFTPSPTATTEYTPVIKSQTPEEAMLTPSPSPRLTATATP